MEADPPTNNPNIMLRIKNMLRKCQIKEQKIQQLPQAFIEFMKERGLDISELAISIPRYVRVKPKYHITTEQLSVQLGLKPYEIEQIEKKFWAIKPTANINHCSLYQEGILYGMDYSSAIPVKCLSLSQNQRVLELCSAPGNKSMLMADLNQGLTVTGVQISQNRANIMKNLVKKYNLSKRIDIVVADATKFESQILYDRVLIDAECTHQGSLKHIYKFMRESGVHGNKKQQKLSKQQEKQFRKNNTNPYTSQIKKGNDWTKEDFKQRFLDQYKLSHLHDLQYNLLKNGFKHAKENGIIVYSTCSFDQSQNQSIVEKFLKEEETAELVDATKDLACVVGYKEGKLPGTLRFSPSLSCCGGMFICKMRKKTIEKAEQ